MSRARAVPLRTAAALVLATLMAILAGSSARASASTNYLDDAVQKIKSGNLEYVSPDVPHNATTQVNGQPGNLIALVEVPAAALAETGGDGQTFANQLDQLTDKRYVIGVAFVSGPPDNPSGTYFAATNRIQDGVLTQLRGAVTTGISPGDVLTTFGENVEQLVTDNPEVLLPVNQPPGSAPSTSSHTSGGGHGLLIALAVMVGLVGLVFFCWRRWLRTIPGLMRQIKLESDKFKHSEAKQIVGDILLNTKEYLVVTKAELSSEDHQSARSSTLDNLRRTLRVAKGYVSMEQRPRYWHGDIDDRLRQTRAAFEKFDEDLLEAIRLANEGQLAEHEMDTTILENSVI